LKELEKLNEAFDSDIKSIQRVLGW
jgi:hypothetical protein